VDEIDKKTIPSIRLLTVVAAARADLTRTYLGALITGLN
jgi:hypothetical protein